MLTLSTLCLKRPALHLLGLPSLSEPKNQLSHSSRVPLIVALFNLPIELAFHSFNNVKAYLDLTLDNSESLKE